MAGVANRWEEHPKKEMSVSVRDREHGRWFLWPYDKGLKGHGPYLRMGLGALWGGSQGTAQGTGSLSGGLSLEFNKSEAQFTRLSLKSQPFPVLIA